MDDDRVRLSRRGLFGAAATVATAGSVAGDAAAQAGKQHVVEMTDDLVFVPDEITIAPGDTVVWENVGQIGHSVTAYEDEIPEGAAYFASGGFDAEQAARQAYPSQGDIAGGERYEHTFSVEGTYEYFCIPHESVGMVGTVVVQPGGAETPAPVTPAVSETARTLIVFTTAALVAVLALTYVFLKFGGSMPPSEGD